MTLFCRCSNDARGQVPIVEDDPADLQGGRGEHQDGSPCPLVSCDDPSCIALDKPHKDSPRELAAAYQHWRRHAYLGGCSHGR